MSILTLKISQVWRISDSTKQICNIYGLDWFRKKKTHVSGPSHLFRNQAVVQYNIRSLSSGCEIPLTEPKNKDITTNQQKQQPKTWRILRWKRCSFRITLSSTFFAPRGFKLSKGSPDQHCLATEGETTRNMTAQLTCSTVQGLIPPSHIPWLGGEIIVFIHLQINGTFQEPLLGGSCTVPSLKIHRGMTRTCSSFESYEKTRITPFPIPYISYISYLLRFTLFDIPFMVNPQNTHHSSTPSSRVNSSGSPGPAPTSATGPGLSWSLTMGMANLATPKWIRYKG